MVRSYFILSAYNTINYSIISVLSCIHALAADTNLGKNYFRVGVGMDRIMCVCQT